jgi:inner membrane protein involved in colicin E2 resistance
LFNTETAMDLDLLYAVMFSLFSASRGTYDYGTNLLFLVVFKIILMFLTSFMTVIIQPLTCIYIFNCLTMNPFSFD